jgi:hypothetical protein
LREYAARHDVAITALPPAADTPPQATLTIRETPETHFILKCCLKLQITHWPLSRRDWRTTYSSAQPWCSRRSGMHARSGRWALVAAGAAVTHDVLDFALVAGAGAAGRLGWPCWVETCTRRRCRLVLPADRRTVLGAGWRPFLDVA